MLIQRVTEASVAIEGHVHASIGNGLLVLLGITHQDTEKDIDYLVQKLTQLRIFSDPAGKMNLSIKDVQGDILLVSQFTLYANTQKGNRPSFVEAAPPVIAIPLYEQCIKKIEKALSKKIATGIFGADMKVSLLNDGPVTIIIDSHLVR